MTGQRAKPRGRGYSDKDHEKAQAMLARGDRIEYVAAFFGANQGRFKRSNIFEDYSDVPSELKKKLPPPGPYKLNTDYVRLYELIVEINE